MKKIRIGIDMDGTIVDLLTPWLKELNLKYNLNYKVEDLLYYNMENSIKELTEEQIFEPLFDSNIFDSVLPIKDASYWLEKLNSNSRFEIYIVTNTHYKNVSDKMEKVLFKYFPFINWKQLICINNKQLLNIDYLIDDYEGNLIGGNYNKILFDAPYNQNVITNDILNEDPFTFLFCYPPKEPILRAKNWKDIYEYFDKKKELI